jgi:hypothetical protein
LQLIGEERIPVPMAPGRPARIDYEYERNGLYALFMLNEPLSGWREVVVGDQRTANDFAQVIGGCALSSRGHDCAGHG